MRKLKIYTISLIISFLAYANAFADQEIILDEVIQTEDNDDKTERTDPKRKPPKRLLYVFFIETEGSIEINSSEISVINYEIQDYNCVPIEAGLVLLESGSYKVDVSYLPTGTQYFIQLQVGDIILKGLFFK